MIRKLLEKLNFIKPKNPAYIKANVSGELNFLFRGQEFNVGDRVKVGKHYAGYKMQYPFMVGEVFLDANNIPKVRIAISPTDIEQVNEQQLQVWGMVEKI